MLSQIKPALLTLAVLTVITGVLYPALMTAFGQIVFPTLANGSIISSNGVPMGSHLIGQSFDDPKYFWGRLSATAPVPYNAAASSGSNYGPLNPALFAAVKGRFDALRAVDSTTTFAVPVDLVTASASGLDPHISPAAAFCQVPRISRTRGIKEWALRKLVENHIEPRQLGFLGEPRVNVLQLNMALDNLPAGGEN